MGTWTWWVFFAEIDHWVTVENSDNSAVGGLIFLRTAQEFNVSNI